MKPINHYNFDRPLEEEYSALDRHNDRVSEAFDRLRGCGEEIENAINGGFCCANSSKLATLMAKYWGTRAATPGFLQEIVSALDACITVEITTAAERAVELDDDNAAAEKAEYYEDRRYA